MSRCTQVIRTALAAATQPGSRCAPEAHLLDHGAFDLVRMLTNAERDAACPRCGE